MISVKIGILYYKIKKLIMQSNTSGALNVLSHLLSIFSEVSKSYTTEKNFSKFLWINIGLSTVVNYIRSTWRGLATLCEYISAFRCDCFPAM